MHPPSDPDSRPAVARALGYVRRILERGAGAGGMPLPSLAALARGAGVSPASMWKAVAILKRAGTLYAVRGGRIRKVTGDAASRNSGVREPGSQEPIESVKWRKVLGTLAGDLASGRLSSPLPPMNRLRARYGISLPTMRKALRALQSRGVLEPEGRTLRIVPLRYRGRSPYASITLVAAAGAKGEFGVFSDHGRSFLEALEGECSQAGVNLEVLTLESGRFPAAMKALRRRAGELGFLLWPGEWQGLPESRAKILEALSVLAASKKPVAVLDEMGGFPSIENIGGRVRIYTVAARRSGLAMADHLLRLGHRRIAYLTPHGNLPWSYLRFQGLGRAFAEAALEGAVLPFSLDYGRQYNRVLQTGAFGTGAGDAAAIRMLGDILRRRLGPGEKRDEAAEAALREGAFPDLIADLKFDVLEGYFQQEVNRAMAPLFRQALEDEGVTAWVGANDATALAAREFLRERGRRVPEDISLAGFDNVPGAFATGLTSYHFRINRFAPILLGYLLDPGRRGGAQEREEVDGVLIARRSTGPAVRGDLG